MTHNVICSYIFMSQHLFKLNYAFVLHLFCFCLCKFKRKFFVKRCLGYSMNLLKLFWLNQH